jgi:hypothetical protein
MFNVNKLSLFPEDFSYYEHEQIQYALEIFLVHMKRTEDFRDYLHIASLANMVELKRHIMFHTIFHLLIELAMLDEW